MITFILAEAELELIPPELLKDPSILARAKKRRREPQHLVLDQAYDHKAMRSLHEGDRRGRPDIAHMILLLVQDSPLTKRGLTRMLIHTRHDELIRVRPDTRIMRNQAKFVTLAEDLLRQGAAPQGAPLLTVERGRTLRSIVQQEARGTKVLLDPGGERARSPRFHDLARAGDLTVILGGFPRGTFRGITAADADIVAQVAPTEITAWSALVPVLAGCEDALLW